MSAQLINFTANKIKMDNLINRITINPDICHGKPSIRNMRYPVEMILDLLSAGMSHQEILADYPALEEDDIKASLAYASRLTKIKSIHKIVA
jgi:uncharacterized protein (DUF433 family)